MQALVSCDRNLPWLGQLENPGILVPLKYVTQINSESLPESTSSEFSIKYIDIGSVEPTGEISQVDEFTFENAPSRARRKVKQGDTLVSTVRPYLKAITYINQNESRLIVSTGFAVLSAKQSLLHARYLYYWMRSDFVVDEICARSVGVSYPATNASEIGSIPIPILPIEQQKSIANFLDRKTAAIDTLVAKKKRLIQLLEEKRTALINQAVTKGLNPNAPMKDSGNPWIGDIPEHWGIVALGYVCNLTSGGTPDRNRPEYWNGDIPWVKTGEIKYNRIDQTEEYITESGLNNSSTKIAPMGTLLMAMYGQGITRGRVAILDIEASFNQACLAIFPRNILDVKYIYYYFINAYKNIRDDGNETSQMNLSAGLISKIKVLFPNIEEQKDIASFLDCKVEYINSLTHKLKTSIDKLQEYRRSLITAVVTGKLAVDQEDAA